MALASCQELCPAREYELSLRTAQLENAYQKCLAEVRHIVDSERARVARVDCLLLATDKDQLQQRCQQTESQVAQLLAGGSDTQQQLRDAQDEISSLKSSLRASAKTIEELEEELLAQRQKLAEYENALADKRNLTKQLSSLQEETERLRKQASSHQALVSEKLALERQLNSLEVQLENERRAFERIKAESRAANDTKTQEKLEKLQAELDKEVAERSRLEKEQQEKTTEWESQKKALEEKLQTLRKQLRTTKDKLKEAQESMEQPSIITRADRTSQTGSRTQTVPLRTSGGFDPDMAIATPGAPKVANPVKRASAAPGDKSTFSITPYLNRTQNTLEAPSSSDHEEHAGAQSDDERPAQKPRRRRSGSDDEGTAGANDRPEQPAPQPKKRQAKSTKPIRQINTDEGEDPALTKKATVAEGKQPVKKRKILGAQRERVLLDEDEEEGDGLADVGGLRDRRLGQGVSLGRPALAKSSLTFDTSSGFSPLKRAKRLI